MPIDKEAVYKRLRTAGLLAVIPVVLGTGPIGGYLIAELLIKKLGFPEITGVVCITLGFLAGVQETVKIVKIALKARE